MEPFELDVVVRKKMVQLRGKVTLKDVVYGDFLRANQKPKSSLLLCLAERLQYQGCELEESLLFTLFILAAEAYNFFYNSNSIFYPISIMGVTTYTLVIGCLPTFKVQMLTQVICLIASLTMMILSLTIGLIDSYVGIGVAASVALVFLFKFFVFFQDYCYIDSPTSGFSFESNLILLLFALWKGFEVVTLGDYSSLFTAMIVLCLVNSVKIYILFDFNVLHVINIFCEQNNKNLLETAQNAQDYSQSIAIFVQTIDDPDSKIPLPEKEDSSVEPNQATNNQVSNDNPITDIAEEEQKNIQYESSKRIAVTIAAVLLFASQIVYTYFNQSSYSLQVLFSTSFSISCQTSFLLMLCEAQKILKGYDKDFLSYIYIYLIDAIIIIFSAVVSYFQSSLSITCQTAIFYSSFPFIIIKMFNSINQQAHTELNNGKYWIFYVFSVLPLYLRSLTFLQGYSIVVSFIDVFVYIYAVAVVGIWENRSDIFSFFKEIKSILSAKKKKIKFFDKLKQFRMNYPNLIQTFIFVHTILLSVLYSFTTFTDTSQQISYGIFYMAPLFLYYICFVGTYNLSQDRPQSYSPDLLTVIALLLSLGYVLISHLSILGDNHENYSLQVLLNIFLFCGLKQGEKVAVIYMQNYCNFIRALFVSIFFLFVYLPFISLFTAGYYFTAFSQDYLFYFALGGFFYIWLIITLAGTAIHLVLNLTEKSKKDLFIAQYMEGEMRKIGLKENVQKILMISNEYEILNFKSQELLKYLKAEKHVMVVIRREKDVPHDYQLVEPDDHLAVQRMAMIAKPINPLDVVARIMQNKEIEPAKQQMENPVLTYFREKEKARIEINKSSDNNANFIELKRMADRCKRFPSDLRELERSPQFRAMQSASSNKCGEMIGKFYNFISQPSECISRQTFLQLLRLLTRQQLPSEQADTAYQKFSESSLINEYKFKKFLVDYVQFKFDMKGEKIGDILRTFCCYQIAPLLLAKCTQLDYHLRRKQISLSQQSKQIWVGDGGSDEDLKQFREITAREARKKEKLLNQIAYRPEGSHKQQQQEAISQEKQEQSSSTEVGYQRQGLKLTRLGMRRQLKDKTFLRPQNIYSTLVNSLIECYLFYQKQAENFKIKSIKLSLSNLLAVATKISDIVLVFGYPTIYLLIAYFQQDYSESTYMFSTIDYTVLITLASTLTCLYIVLILYHKKDFEMGSLGLDEQHRSLSICSFKFFATKLLFILGSALANYIIAIGLNSLICNQTTQTLFNFSSQTCYGQRQYVYIFVSLLVMVVYWPLSAITFPFSTAMDRSLQIKYKSQFQIIYLQFKFLLNGYNTLLGPYVFQTEQMIVSVMKVVICLTLALVFRRLQPCSYELFNKIQGKIYVLLTILSFAGALCYFVGILYSVIITGSFIFIYLIYFIYVTIKSYQTLNQDSLQDDILQDNIHNQKMKINIIKENQPFQVNEGKDEDQGQAQEEKGRQGRKIVMKNTPKNEDDQLSEVKLAQFPTQDLRSTPRTSKNSFKFW